MGVSGGVGVGTGEVTVGRISVGSNGSSVGAAASVGANSGICVNVGDGCGRDSVAASGVAVGVSNDWQALMIAASTMSR